MLKSLIKKIIQSPLIFFEQLKNFYRWIIPGRFKHILDQTLDDITQTTLNASVNVKLPPQHHSTEFRLLCPNRLCRWRASNAYSAEPETLQWLDSLPKNPLFLDIGANIGIYSIYLAKTREEEGTKIFAVEPSFYNLRVLSENINLNRLEHKISIIPLPIAEKSDFSLMKIGSRLEGGALSVFRENYGHDGKPIESPLQYRVFGFSLDDMVSVFMNGQVPSAIKLDVDGIEHLILRGGSNIIGHPKCRDILVEVNDDFEEQSSAVQNILRSHKFELIEKKSSEIFSGTDYANVFNQIWQKRG